MRNVLIPARTVLLVVTYFFLKETEGQAGILRNAGAINVVQVKPHTLNLTVPCTYNDDLKRPLYLFHNKTQIASHDNSNYDPKIGFHITVNKELPVLGAVYECRVPSGQWGAGGQYTVVRFVPNWGIKIEPESPKTEIMEGRPLRIKCSSRFQQWKPLTLLHNLTATNPMCHSETNELECNIGVVSNKTRGRYHCIVGSAPMDTTVSTALQYQIVASWKLDVLSNQDKVKIKVDLGESKTTLICNATRGVTPQLEYCACKDEKDCERIRNDMVNVSSCESLAGKGICTVIENLDTKTDTMGEIKIKSVSISSIETIEVYRCYGRVQGSSINCDHGTVIVQPPKGGLPGWVVAVIIIIVILLIGTVVIAIFYRQKFVVEKFKVQKLTEQEIYEFINGNQREIDNDKDIATQAHLLPYDRSLEFPMSQLHLEKELGSGAYGVVYKAKAFGLFDGGAADQTTVAVKTINPLADDMFFRALLMELKIMAYIGKHINVVSLLGAVTENIETREVYLVMEYCQYGNLHEFLNKYTDNFVSLLDNDPQTPQRSFSSDPDDLRPEYSNDIEMKKIPTNTTEEEPLWRTGLAGEYMNLNMNDFNTNTLMNWSHQVAKGMAYLACRKVIHGDLATRNILIAAGHVVKVADFGLARQLYHNPEYTKTQKNPLPVKWMALESLTRMAFSSQSDVWAFGITLWEMFSLGETPYQGMQIGEEFVEKIRNGYRMKSPRQCPQDMFVLMKKCWEANPQDRPTFDQICETLSDMLANQSPYYNNAPLQPDENEPIYGNL